MSEYQEERNHNYVILMSDVSFNMPKNIFSADMPTVHRILYLCFSNNGGATVLRWAIHMETVANIQQCVYIYRIFNLIFPRSRYYIADDTLGALP